MRSLILTVVGLLLALGVVEGVAYWWMHPKPAGLGEPVLVYRPGSTKERSVVRMERSDMDRSYSRRAPEEDRRGAGSTQLSVKELSEKRPPPAPGLTTDNSQQTTDNSPTSTHTPLPDVVTAALPSLRCSTGTAARIDRDDNVTIHVAFFEWDLSSSTSVLEAFKHLPEECMGSIGMTLVEKAPVRTFVVGGHGGGDSSQETEVSGQRSEIKAGAEATAQSSSSNQKSAINNQQSSIYPSSSDHSLSFDHTVFRDQRGVIVHAFKGTWVSGATELLGESVRGGAELWNQIRRNAAFKRFRPAHARVVQGAVRGIANPDLAWEAFEEAMLRDLSFQ